MIFGPAPLDEAEGAILAHTLKLGSVSFKKGRVLSAEDVTQLRAAGEMHVISARLEPDDVHEDEAAAAIAAAVMGEGLTVTAAFTGRCNLTAAERGLLLVERERLDRLNRVHESITIATLMPYEMVETRQMAATIKIIPFAVPRPLLDSCLVIAAEGPPLIRFAPFAPRQVGLVQTTLPGLKPDLLDKTLEAVNARLAALDCPPARERRCRHDPDEVARAVKELAAAGCRILLVSGASAIVDRCDVVPAGVLRAGGTVEHLGMPVDPGNLLLLGRLEGLPVIGLPGCARSPKSKGFDWVLRRLVAGLEVTAQDLMGMGAGGLLKEIASRPLPRATAVEQPRAVPRAPRVGAVILAGGRSTRMGSANKLLTEIDGAPMIARVTEAARASQGDPVIVVTGHERENVEAVLAGLGATLVHNPAYASGLSSSLHRGLAALPAEMDGAVILLGDMPRVSAAVIDRLIAAFDPLDGRAICLPTWQGRRGNPVLFARRFFAEIQAISGDLGARALIGDYPDLICEVAMPDDAVLVDVDTPAALAALKSTS